MTWFRLSDDWLMTPKAQAAGLQGRALWMAVGAGHCAKDDTDGVIDGRMLKVLAAAAEVNLKRAAEALVDAGLWHTPENLRGCPPCHETARKRGGLQAGDFFHHGFLETNLDQAGKNDQIARNRDLRRRKIRANKALVAELRTRHRDRCAYCDVLTVWIEQNPDRKSKSIGEIDHVDPFGPDYSPSNLVVACKGCNADKKERTPAEWAAKGGRLLLRPIDEFTDPTWVDPGSTPDSPGPDQAAGADLPRVTRDSGRNRDRAGSGPGQVRVPGPGTPTDRTEEHVHV